MAWKEAHTKWLGASEERSIQKGLYIGAAFKPNREGRHGQPDVFAQGCHQRGGIGVFPGSDITAQEGRELLIHARRGIAPVLSLRLLQGEASALQGTIDLASAHIQYAGGLNCAPTHDIAQEQNRALPAGEL